MTLKLRVTILLELPPSLTLTEITADPLALVTGTMVSAPLLLGLK